MKKIITLLVLALMVQFSFAQEIKKEAKNDDMKTIFNKENLKFTGGYIAPEIKVSNVNEDASLFLGAKIAFTMNEKFSIGLAGYGLVNNSNFDINPVYAPTTTQLSRISMGYGGLAMEYALFTNKKIHFTIPVVVGAAGIYLYEDNGDYFNSQDNEIENSAALVVEPGVNVELNMFKFFRVDLGASYRLISQTDLLYLTDQDLSDLSFNVTFKFGFF